MASMWARGVGGALLVLIGIVWILQGFNVIRGSGMSGHVQYAVLGLVAILFGGWLLSAIRPTKPGSTGR